MKVLIKVEIDESRQWAEANKLYDLLKNYKPVLMPMPMKRETEVHWKSIGGGDIPTHEPSGEDIGWNKCVDYLEGDMQDD